MFHNMHIACKLHYVTVDSAFSRNSSFQVAEANLYTFKYRGKPSGTNGTIIKFYLKVKHSYDYNIVFL